MKQINLTTLIALLLLPLGLFAHEASITGRVVSSYTNEPLKQIILKLANTDFTAITDSLGNFQFNNIPARNYTLVIDATGYFKMEREIDLKEDQVLSVTVFMYPEMINIPSVSVSGSRNSSAASSQILTNVDLELRPRNSAQDILRIVPGLFIAQHAGGGKAEQIFVRGFDCDHGTDVAVFVDGIPVNLPSHGHGQGYADLHFLIPEVVSTLDVFKGPYQAKYGNFATGAAVEFHTMDTLPRNMVKLELGSVPTNRGFASSRILIMTAIPLPGSKVSSYVAGEYNYVPSYFEINQRFNRFNVFGKVKAKLTDNTSLTLSVGSFGSTWNASGQIPVRAVENGSISRFGTIDPTEGGTTQRTNVNLQFAHNNGNSQLLTNLYYFNYGFKLYSNFTFFANDSINGDEIEQNDQRSVIGFNTQYSRYYNVKNVPSKTTFGFGVRMDNIDNSLHNAVKRTRTGTIAAANIKENNMSLFVKQDFEFAQWFRADVALRADYFIFNVEDLMPTDSSHTNYSGYNYQVLPSYKLNLVFTPIKNLEIYVNNGIGFHSNDARSVLQNLSKHLLPIALGSEVGAQYHLGNRILLTTALWTMDISNELVFVGDDGTTEDKGSSRRYGVDFGGRIQLAKWLFADADITVSRNVFTNGFLGGIQPTDNLVPLAPTLTSSGGLTARHKNGFKESIRYRTIADRPANESNTVTAQGYVLIDLFVSYETKKYMISLSVENLFNTEWNEAQFDTESRLIGEEAPVSELHFTPGTPLALKAGFSYFF
ncbi:TonB-dependent receptor [soil metagenome]